MSIDWVEDLEQAINSGHDYYACPGVLTSEWYISSNIQELRMRAQRTANQRKFAINIYRLVNRMDTVSGDSYLVVRKFLDPGPRGEPKLLWSLVDTREAAELMRDVSQGPSPYFGAVVAETFQPEERK